MKKPRNSYVAMMAHLDNCGLITAIVRINRRHFTFLVNGTAVKTYKTRNSCNRQLLKLHQQNSPSNEI